MMSMGMPWANWLMGMNDKMIGPQGRAAMPQNPGVRYTGGTKPSLPQPKGPNLRAPQTGKGFQQLNKPTPNWGVGGGMMPSHGSPLPPLEQYAEGGFA